MDKSIAQSRAFLASQNKPLECIMWADMSEFLTKWLPACIALAHTDYLNVRYSFVFVVLHCNYYPYLTYLWPEYVKWYQIIAVYMHTGYHSHSNGSWRNVPEVFLCTERPEETDWWTSQTCFLLRYLRLPDMTVTQLYWLYFSCSQCVSILGSKQSRYKSRNRRICHIQKYILNVTS